MINCEVCRREGKEFSVPYSGTTGADAISIELMKAHLHDEHGIAEFAPAEPRSVRNDEREINEDPWP